MATIDDLIRKHETFNVNSIMRQALLNTKEALLEAQRLQMLEGKNADGRKIGKYLNQRYAQKKWEINPIPGLGVPDLRLTGEWQGEIQVQIGTDTVEFVAPENEKTARLIGKFGIDILGLSNQNALIYANEYLKPEFLRLVNNALR